MIGHRCATQTHRHKQQTKPAAHQEGEGSLYIHLSQRDQRGHHRRGAANGNQHGLHQRAQFDEGLQAQQHPGATNHHYRVAQHGGGQGALHGLIQPEVQRNLGALAHGAGDQG